MSQAVRSTRRHFLGALLATPLVLRYTPAYAGASAPGKRFTIVHTNDPHGHLLPFSYADKTAPGDFVSYMPEHVHIGGIARRATMIQRIKKGERNVHVFDLGDSMDGTPFSVEYLGKADYEANSLVGFDMGTFGNHDFNMTPAQWQEMRGYVKYPMVLANVYDKATNKPIETPYVIENWDGLKVALLGLTTYSSRTYKAISDTCTMREPAEVAKELVPKLREQADLVIVLSHCGYDEDKAMASDVPGIDVIVGAHSHTRLPVGDYEYAKAPRKGDPQGTVIVQAHCWGGELGRLDFLAQQTGVDGKWRVAQYTAGLIMMDDAVPEHPAVRSVVSKYWKPIEAKYGEVIGVAKDEFVDVKGQEATNYNLMCDAILSGLGDAQFEIENFGGVRAPVLRGDITRADLVSVDPFTNTVVTFDITGANLKKLIEKNPPASSHTLRYTATHLPADASGKRAWQFGEGTIGGQPIDDATVYKGAASSYYFGSDIKPFATNAVDTGIMRLPFLVAYIKKNTPIAPVADSRVKLFGD